MKRFFTFIALVILCLGANAIEHFAYDMLLFGNKIGRMTVTREVKKDGTEFYVLETSAKTKILWITRENYTRYEVAYQGGKLISSLSEVSENGEEMHRVRVTRDSSRYVVDSYRGKRYFTEIPTFSIVTLFFKDISRVNRIFYEGDAEFRELKKSDERDTWEFITSEGNRNLYHFAKGVIQSMEFHVSFATVKLMRVD